MNECGAQKVGADGILWRCQRPQHGPYKTVKRMVYGHESIWKEPTPHWYRAVGRQLAEEDTTT